ncbi:MAG TPA: pentapeptide repeat-containing protein [Nitrososphaera sp.]|nr:pentapeptide repeat-containing protein [Nitrososphaera sp.]
MDLSAIDNNNCRSKQVAITICSIVGTIMIAFMLFSSSNMPSSTIRIASATIVTNDTNTATTDVQRIEALLEIVRCNAPFRSNVDLSGCDLFGASFEEADLTNADLSFTDLSFTDLANATLGDADLTNATLGDADLTNADLTNATLIGTNFLGAVMTDCIGCPQ